MTSRSVYIEMGEDFLKVLAGDAGLELPLERLENRRLNPAHREKLVAGLQAFLREHRTNPVRRAFCAIGARGVSLRRWTLPAASKEELQRLLLLQIEREFPVAPDELAWGYRVVRNGSGKPQEVIVAAARAEIVQECSEILLASGLTPEFTLGAWARGFLVAHPPASHAVLEIGADHSELIIFEQGVPVSIRLLARGAALIGADSEMLTKSLQPIDSLRKLYLCGPGLPREQAGPQLSKAIGVDCEILDVPAGPGRSAAIAGLKKACEAGGGDPLTLQLKAATDVKPAAQPMHLKWAALAVLLLGVVCVLRYAEVFFHRPRLMRRIAEFNGYREKLPQLDRELSFLQYMKTNQPPYLASIVAMVDASPSGARIDSLSMNRRGDLALRATMKDSPQVADFRSKLIRSGYFSSVVVEEQTPSPDRQKVTVRLVGQWKPAGADNASAADPGKSKSPTPESKPNPPEVPGRAAPAASAPAVRMAQE